MWADEPPKNYTGKTGYFRDRHGYFMWDIWFMCAGMVVFCTFVLAVLTFPLYADGVEYGPYRCEDRGGIKQITSNRRGDVDTLLCNDGTIQSSTQKLHGVRWKWNRPEEE